MTTSRKSGRSALDMFAGELRAARTAAQLSQEQLGAKITYSGSLVGMIETARRPPSLDFAERCDEALHTGGLFVRLHGYVSNEMYPSWFREWVEIERVASWLRWFEPLLIPGLLQTTDYARAILSAQPGVDDGELDQLVSARLERQGILSGETPPRLWCMLDEGVLHRCIGGAKVMHAQLVRLSEMSQHPKITIQIVPFDAGAHACLLGAFIIASVDDGPSTVYLETAASGYLVEVPSVVGQVTLTYETLRSDALPAGASRDLIMKVAEEKWI